MIVDNPRAAQRLEWIIKSRFVFYLRLGADRVIVGTAMASVRDTANQVRGTATVL